ncbi:MAG: hypothetical protein OEZ54_00780, partial [Gemmatimonadota bacterium]|nr:hypothetical protein [Gemmatimonadota bacterium]
DDRALFLSAQRMRTSIPSLGLAIAQTRSSALSRFADGFPSDSAAPLTEPEAPPYERLWQAAGIVLGFCGNPREILFGIDSNRVVHFERVREELADVPHHEQWFESIDEWVDAYTNDPKVAPLPKGAVPMLRLSFVGMGSTSRRIAFCNSLIEDARR